MKYSFLFVKNLVLAEYVSQFQFPSGTPWPLFTWALTILGEDGKKKGVVGDLQGIVTKQADLVLGYPTPLYLVAPFKPEDMKEILQHAKDEGGAFDQRVLDLYIERLQFASESARSKTIGFARYELFASKEELIRDQEQQKDPHVALMREADLLNASIHIKELTGYELLSILEVQARLGIK